MKFYNHLFLVLCLIMSGSIYAQQDRKLIREGNREFEKEKYGDSEILYRKAMEDTKLPYVTSFNIGDALYKQEKYEEAAKKFQELSEQGYEKLDKSGSFHNLGNSFLQANKLKESIEAYKSALRQNPDDLETKYNLAFAQDKLKEQQEQQEQQEQNKDKNKDQDQDNQDKKQDQENQDDNQDQKDKDQENEPQEKDQNQSQDQKPAPDQISKEVAERILQALQEEEKDVQEKVKKAKASKMKVKTVINW